MEGLEKGNTTVEAMEVVEKLDRGWPGGKTQVVVVSPDRLASGGVAVERPPLERPDDRQRAVALQGARTVPQTRSERRGASGPHERAEPAGVQGSPAIQAMPGRKRECEGRLPGGSMTSMPPHEALADGAIPHVRTRSPALQRV